MTLLQMQYAHECAKAGSFNKAAENLLTTSSNVGKAIKSLESELGFMIFVRSSNGITPTREGVNFLERTRKILDEVDSIKNCRYDTEKHCFRMFSTFTPITGEIFSSITRWFTSEHSDYTLILHYGSIADTKQLILSHQYDAALIFIDDRQNAFLEDLTSTAELGLEIVAERNNCVTVHKGHPIALRYEESGELDAKMLFDYPCVTYNTDGQNTRKHGYVRPIAPYIDQNKVIQTNHHMWRDQIVDNTDAFSIGVPCSRHYLQSRNRVAIPIPYGNMVKICIVYCENEKNSEKISVFREAAYDALRDDE